MSFFESLSTSSLEPGDAHHLILVLDGQAAESAFGSSTTTTPVHKEWYRERKKLELLIQERSPLSMSKAIKTIAKILDVLDLYTPALKGLHHVHSYICERLESLVFDSDLGLEQLLPIGYLYGQAMALSPTTADGAALAVDNLLLRGESFRGELVLCILLGVERSSPRVFEASLTVLLRQTQASAFSSIDNRIPREALLRAMAVYSPTEKASSCRDILEATHAMLAAALALCKTKSKEAEGVTWACFIIEHTPMRLRLDLRHRFPVTCNGITIFDLLQTTFPRCSNTARRALCGALPVLATWDTQGFVDSSRVKVTVDFMLGLPVSLRTSSLDGLGQLASVVLDRFALYLDDVGQAALALVKTPPGPADLAAGQKLLGKLLAALGPITTNIMIEYLQNHPNVLLADVGLLEMIATLLPNLSRRIITILVEVIDTIMGQHSDDYELSGILAALKAFPLNDAQLVEKAQELVLWCLDETKGQDVVVGALELVTEPAIATADYIRAMTYKAAQLLLAEDPVLVHCALNKLSNPSLANSLDEKSCRMILLALHQSLEPSIEVVAAKLLTHLATAHRAIVQPLAWSHIRQSFSLMDFLKTVDPQRAIIEACIISNLLPALPPSLHKKYVRPVKELILSGLETPKDGHLLSLIFQGLANLAKFEGWGSAQQSELANDLLEMSQEIPRDSQHAALHAISRLLAVPQEGLDVYNLLLAVHTAFGGRHTRLDADLKALVAGIYGHLGTVERDPMISRDSRAAITRETSFYTPKTVLSAQVAEVRDRSGSDSQTHINWLVTKSLMSAMSLAQRSNDERSLVLEVMTSLGILQPHAITQLIPDLPALIMRELRFSPSSTTSKESTPNGIAILFLSSALHMSPLWLEQYWADAADVFGQSIVAGEALSVLRGLEVVLDSVVV